MKRGKRLLSTVLAGTLVIGVVSMGGCHFDPDPLEPVKYKTVVLVDNNKDAQKSIADTAVRYFYLINNEKYDEAFELVDRDDMPILTEDILKKMYGNVLNYELGDFNRVTNVNVVNGVAQITFVNLNDDERSWDTSYTEEERPVWLDYTVPYVSPVSFASTYSISDMNEDDVIDETDMLWEDNPELDPDYEAPEVDDTPVSTTSSSARYTSTYSTQTIVQPMAVDIGDIKKSSNTDDSSKKTDNDKQNDSSKQTDKSSDTDKQGSSKSDDTSKGNDTSGKETSKSGGTSESKKPAGNETSVDNETPDVSEVPGDDETSEEDETPEEEYIDGMPADIFKQDTVIGYKTYRMDITINLVNGRYMVQLPSTMARNHRLMIKLPEDMYMSVGGIDLDKSIMNLDDFYVITKLPNVDEFDIEVHNLILGSTTKHIDLTNRVYYIYSSLTPTREMKDDVLEYAKPALQSLYNNMLKHTEFTKSSFVKDYVSSNGNVQNIKLYYDKYLFEHNTSVTYEIINVSFPTDDDYGYYDTTVTPDMFKVTSYYFVDVPIVAQIRANYSDDSDIEINRIEVYGLLRLTRQDGKWYVWDISKDLMLDE